MHLRLYNSLTGKIQPFRSLKKGEVRIYTCGPTVYDYPHIGNLRSFVFADVLRRWLESSGFRVRHVINITDIDDKTIRGSRKAGVPLKDFTGKYEKAFFDDLKLLNIKKAHRYPRATRHIKEMISLIAGLEARKLAYVARDGVYFDISSFSKYGRLSGIAGREQCESRIAADEYGKEHIQDFALWKFWKRDDGPVFWQSPWGMGRPGWHIECSAMSMKYLGKSFDIHTGGVDLKFPHHENEIAQSTGATGKPFVKYWLHSEHLMVEERKMAKSLGNIITLQDVAERYPPSALRYLFLTTHYRSQMNFTWASLRNASETLGKISDFYAKVLWLSGLSIKERKGKRQLKRIRDAEKEFERRMNDDLRTPLALSALHRLISDFNSAFDSGAAGSSSAKRVLAFLRKANNVLDIIDKRNEKISAAEKALVKRREQLRKKKKFEQADIIREQLRKKGIELEDTPYGPRWRKVI